MGFFNKKRPEGLPHSSYMDDDYGGKNKEVFDKLKEEPGYNTLADLMNEKIEKGDTADRYTPDELFAVIEKLENEYYELRSRPEVQEYLEKDANMQDLQFKIKELRSEIEKAMTGDSVAIDYKDKIIKLRFAEQAIKRLKEGLGRTPIETENATAKLVNMENAENKLKEELKKKYGNQDIKSVDGQYLN